MGVAHLLDLEGDLPNLAGLGTRRPLLQPQQLLFFACDNVTTSEEQVIREQRIARIPLTEVVSSPEEAAHRAREWAESFDHLLIHLDVNVLDFIDMPLAENTRRSSNLTFDTLMTALRVLTAAPNLSVLTLTELNPDHSDEATLRHFTDHFAAVLVAGWRHNP